MGSHILYLLLNFLYVGFASNYLSDYVISCTNINIRKTDIVSTVITDMYRCLDNTLLINLKEHEITDAIGPQLHNYINALHTYERQAIYVDETNKVTRLELVAIQQDAVTTLARVAFVTKNVRLPATYRLSNERLIEETNTFIHFLKHTTELMESIPPLLIQNINIMSNLTLPFATLDEYEKQKSDTFQQFVSALEAFQQYLHKKIQH